MGPWPHDAGGLQDGFGADDWQCGNAYPSAESAQKLLARKGYVIQLPAAD